MRRALLSLLLAGAGLAAAGDGMRGRLASFFGEWYSDVPGSRVTVTPAPEVAPPGLTAWRVERRSDSRSHQESTVALLDRAKDEVFVGDVFDDPGRRAARRPFDERADLRNVEASLADAFGLPVRVRLGGGARGALRPIRVEIQQREGAVVERPGFVSEDGALLALGEFHLVSESLRSFRRRLLGQTPGVRLSSGRFVLVEFLDFQCERCRARVPEVEKTVTERGGAVETRFLPLTRTHDWAFAAAESAAALATVDPALYLRYRGLLFERAEGLSEKGCRELASDVALGAGVGDRYEEELASGRARERVLADIALAMRLGISGTPSFVYDGTIVSGEKGLIESFLWASLGGFSGPGPR